MGASSNEPRVEVYQILLVHTLSVRRNNVILLFEFDYSSLCRCALLTQLLQTFLQPRGSGPIGLVLNFLLIVDVGSRRLRWQSALIFRGSES